MQYLSLSFVAFVAIAFVLYNIIPKRLRWGVLLIASVAFYGLFGLKYLPFLLFAALSTWLTALVLAKVKLKKLLVALCILANVGVWFYIKELPWLLAKATWVLTKLGLTLTAPTLSVIVPVGISYFTLQAIAYLVDVAKGKVQAERNPARYLLFLSYFPAIVQGPISRYSDLAPQLAEPKSLSFEDFRKALILVAVGLVKKVVVADRLAILVNNGFTQFAQLNGLVLYLVAIGYAIQLYMDFSGCVDICRGVSNLFGIRLVNNFNRPYLATSIREFWSKWHMSLSSWLKDYVYIPLGGNRNGVARKYLNLLITFLVSGLWHGAGYTFFVWGALHAIYQIVGQMTAKARGKLKTLIGVESGSLSERIYQVVITFNLVAFAWIFFRAPGLTAGMGYIARMFSEMSLNGLGIYELGVGKEYFPLLILHLIVFFAVEHRTKSQDDAVDGIAKQHIIIRWVIYLVLIFDVILFGAYGNGYDLRGFLYGGF